MTDKADAPITSGAGAASSGVALFDERPFFEKALAHGVAHGLINAERIEALRTEAPKGMVQIARYFGTEFLRPDLEKARERIVNLVSLYLQESCEGDLQRAALALRDHSLLSRSKGGSDMLKAMIAMPQNTHFGMQDGRGFADEHIPVLERWSLRSHADYRAERAKRDQVARVMDAAVWCAQQWELDADTLHEEAPDAEAVLRTTLLWSMAKRSVVPDWPAFEQTIAVLRKKFAATAQLPALVLPKGLPAAFAPALRAVADSLHADWARIMDVSTPSRKLFGQTPAFTGRYFWLEDGLAEVEDFERQVSAAWSKATGGHEDEGSLLTLLLCVAAGSAHKTLLTEKSAATLIRKIRKTGMDAERASGFIREHAPSAYQSDYLRMWDAFTEDAMPVLRSDADYAMHDAMALLRRECNIGA
jgi:hypothetical protein